jgi:hypothetical protein
MKLRTTFLLAAAFSAITASAMAAPHENIAFIKEYDLNGDGQVSLPEFKAKRWVIFLTTDFDNNGTLNEAEYVGEFEARLMKDLSAEGDYARRKEDYQRQMKQAVVRFGVLDTNKDGAMTYEEYLASGLKMFERHDRDKDGFVGEKDRAILEKEEKAGKGDDFISPGSTGN